MPTLMSLPFTEWVVLATADRNATSPCEVVAPTFATAIAGRANRRLATAGRLPIAPSGSRPETTRPATAASWSPNATSSAASTSGSESAIALMVTIPPSVGTRALFTTTSPPGSVPPVVRADLAGATRDAGVRSRRRGDTLG